MDKNVCGDITVDDQFGVPDPVRRDSFRQSCSACASHFFKILEEMERERSLAADREKRLNSKIDDLARLVSFLTEIADKSGSTTHSMVAAKAVGHDETNKSKGKPRRKKRPADSKASLRRSTDLSSQLFELAQTAASKASTRMDLSSQRFELAQVNTPDMAVGASEQPSSTATDSGSEDDSASRSASLRSRGGLGSTRGTSNPRTKIQTADVQERKLLPCFEDEPDNLAWQLISNTKPTGKKAVLFAGNLRHDMESDHLSQFIAQRASATNIPVTIHECKIFCKEDSISARIVVNHASSKTLLPRKFWPSPVYCRLWSFDKYLNSAADHAAGQQSASQSQP